MKHMRLVKYLKPFALLILLAVVLLFGQAMADLTLPDYMSRIVNVGIQQGGVEDAVPEAIRASEMDRLTLFMSADDQAAVLDQYTLVPSGSPAANNYIDAYPALAEQGIYVLNEDVNQETIDRLNPIMGRAWLAVSGIQQAMENPDSAALFGAESGFDLSQLPAGTDIFALLRSLPDAQREMMLSRFDEQFQTMGDSMIVQSAVLVVQSEYDALGMNSDRLQNRYIINTGLVMLMLALVSGAAAIAVGYLSARVAAGAARNLRRDVFMKVEEFSSAEFNKFSTASLITRTTNDITQIQMVTVMMIRMVFYAPIIGVGGILHALNKGTSMWWIIAAAVIILVALVAIVFNVALPRFKRIQSLIDRLNLVMRENLTGMMVIRAFNRQDFELKRFDEANVDLTSTMLFISRVMVVMMPIMMLVMNGIMVLIVWVGAHQVAQANMQVGDMMAFMQYALQIVMSFLMLTMMFIILPRAAVSADRIAEVLDTPLTITDPAQPKPFPQPFKGTVEFNHVSFRYPGAEEDVLHDINFTATPGETTAFIGSTGSGKSTVINLIPRFYDVTSGEILVDGIDIRKVDQHELRRHIGYIPQKGTLFSGTIDSNLRYANEHASEEDVRQAIEIAQAATFVEEKPEGLYSEIAQGGTNVSGGQKQRLSIARAIVTHPPIYIFDDSFSALDFKTEAALRQALKDHTQDSTILMVTQRVAAVQHAEQIIVLDEGRIVGKGTHEELMNTCETYRQIAYSQLSQEELTA